MTWTKFMDMYSGGDCKTDYEYIYIEEKEGKAIQIFKQLFGYDPYNVTCVCCGEDYSVSEADTLENITGYERDCEFCYYDPYGRECSSTEAWVKHVGIKDGYSSGYADRPKGKESYIRYLTLDQYKKKENVKIIYKKDIKV